MVGAEDAVSADGRWLLAQITDAHERVLAELIFEAGAAERAGRTGVAVAAELGRRETLVELILALLEVRGVSIDDDNERRIRRCEQLGTLQRWAKLAREIEASEELFASE